MRSEKGFFIKSVVRMIEDSDYCFFISFAGIQVKAFNDLRKQIFAAGGDCRVVKNSFIAKAAQELKIENIETVGLTGSTAMVFGKGDCGAVAKLIVEFGKTAPQLVAKGGYMDGSVMPAADVTALAELPSKDVLRAMLLGVLQAPSRNLVTVLNAKAASILNVINAYKQKLENN